MDGMPAKTLQMHVRMSGVPLYPQAADPLDHAGQETSEEDEPVDGRNSELETVRYNLVREYHGTLPTYGPGSERLMPILSAMHQRRKFILKLAYALMEFGAPMHKIDEQLTHVASFLVVGTHFALLNTVIIVVFDGDHGEPSNTHFVQQPQGLSLAQLQQAHTVYTQVIHDEISAWEGVYALQNIMDNPETYAIGWKVLLAFFAGFTICPMGFSGSLVDGLVAGGLSALLMFIQVLSERDAGFVGIFEMTIAIFVSLIARVLNSVQGHIFCYSAISSAGVVLILPGFLVLQGSLELASKNFTTGSTKLIFAIIYSLILGFSLTLGSDLAFIVMPNFRAARDQMAVDMAETFKIIGSYSTTNSTQYSSLNGTFGFQQLFVPDEPLPQYHYILNGCYRDPAWPVILQPVDWKFLFILVPVFVFCLASLNGQRYRGWKVWFMVAFGCCSFAANKLGNTYIYEGSDVVSSLGATVIGILGTVYGHYSKGDALPSMIPGILVLLPAGLSVVGGLSSNFQDPNDSGLSWLVTGMRMVQVTIGITIGLFASNCIVYSSIAFANVFRKHSKFKLQDGTAF